MFPKRTRVVRLRRTKDKILQGCDVYIGREWHQGGWDLPQSKWHNPFRGKDAVVKFEEYLSKNEALIKALPELRGKVLGCWCKVKPSDPCHGDVLVKWAERG